MAEASAGMAEASAATTILPLSPVVLVYSSGGACLRHTGAYCILGLAAALIRISFCPESSLPAANDRKSGGGRQWHGHAQRDTPSHSRDA